MIQRILLIAAFIGGAIGDWAPPNRVELIIWQVACLVWAVGALGWREVARARQR
jgi:hypothetical protein